MERPRTVTIGVEMFSARTPTLPPATHTNSYALGGSEVLLIEPATPFEDEQRAWIEWARALSSQGRELLAIVATHHHPDHVGGALLLSRELGLPLWAHARTIDRLAEPGAPAGASGAVFDRTLTDGETIDLAGPSPQRWRVLHTPGHAPGHVCLFEEGSLALIAGDMVASEGTILIEPRDGDMQVYLQQLDRLAGLGARLALPAHGGPIDEPTALFRHYIRHRLAREDKVVKALSSAPGPRSIEELIAEVYSDTPVFLWPLARMSLAAHLVKLEREHRASRGGSAGFAGDHSEEGAPRWSLVPERMNGT